MRTWGLFWTEVGSILFPSPRSGTSMATQPADQPAAARTDPVRVDPKHYTVELENEKVRVLRIKYGPREKSEMHGHPALLGIMLTPISIMRCATQPAKFAPDLLWRPSALAGNWLGQPQG